MSKFDFFEDWVNTGKEKVRSAFAVSSRKSIMACAAAVVLSAALVVSVTLTVRHISSISQGKGGLDNPKLAELTQIAETTQAPLEEEVALSDLMNPDGEANSAAPDSAIASAEPNAETVPASSAETQQEELSYFTYRVKQGDMIGAIAEKFGVTQDTIISVNNIRQSRLIQIGQYLKIPSMPGIVYTVKGNGETVNSIAQKYSVDATKCALANNIASDTSLQAGKSLFVPDAKMDWVTRQEINGDLFHKPLKVRYYMSSYYGWRKNPFNPSKRTYHGGIDMACAKGNIVYAALSGKVITAGWNNTYGNYVIIQHHSGYQTLYGHMSEILVRKGQFVYQDTRIGKVGSTGLSTGPHLHFAVYKNGKSVNPANLWG